MIALDSDIYSLYIYGNESIIGMMQQRLHQSIALPVVVAEEALRGRLNAIRAAQTTDSRDRLPGAYERLAFTINSIATFRY
jgi:predicted nucleic acid-binding protein